MTTSNPAHGSARKRSLLRSTLTGLALGWCATLPLGACDDDAEGCVEGVTQECVCADGDGAQVCQADGTWGACDCGGNANDGDGEGGGDDRNGDDDDDDNGDDSNGDDDNGDDDNGDDSNGDDSNGDDGETCSIEGGPCSESSDCCSNFTICQFDVCKGV